jgi:glutathione S-transferase
MKLFYSPTSPYVRKVRVIVREKGMQAALEEVACNPYQDPPELQQSNPLGKVPALVLADGSVLFDSPVICEFLDTLGDPPRLIPLHGSERWTVLTAQALADGVLDAAVALTLEGRRPPGERSSSMTTRWRHQIERSVDAMAKGLGALPPSLCLGHVAYACALGYLDFRQPTLSWREGRGELARWCAEFADRPSMAATIPNE